VLASPDSLWRPGPARLAKLVLGLLTFGAGEAAIVAADLGNSPWTVLAQGAAEHLPVAIGTATVAISFLVLLAWIPLRQRPGLGTILNAILIGLAIDATLTLLPDPDAIVARAALLAGGIALVSLGSGLYLTSRLGPGPRDGLMTGLSRRTGRSLRLWRTVIELSALAVGFALGGVVGIGTVAFAALIGPGVQAAVHHVGGRDRRPL
jgi:uncharacterized membrane protein YczE